ncbi:hypothetical protein Ctob_013943 [Chrysochromulina tobinii]|uniref:Uncharacterized protein n=1 Tax=Chrysochromulina tobinii TaxID=1460289 RepID=A0A0M0K858_9EUKA|nr:hypothetical protein Ctob_013943 [Chrysochromulina tobinii]|eukprot:KOO35041.1 hypothetical protein Ctob_013943 [Chrysochromulina sp. CCMP291]
MTSLIKYAIGSYADEPDYALGAVPGGAVSGGGEMYVGYGGFVSGRSVRPERPQRVLSPEERQLARERLYVVPNYAGQASST